MHGLNEHRSVIYAHACIEIIFVDYIAWSISQEFSIIDNSGRYNDFAKQLNANGYKVYGMDWVGKSKNHLFMLTIEFLPLYKPRLSVCVWLKMLSTVLGHL